MTNVLSPLIKQVFYNNGVPNVGGLVFTYAAGTSTPIATYTATGSTNTNPIVLNSRGECDLWQTPNVGYKIALQDASGNPIWTVDNVINSQLLTLYGGVDTGIANAYVVNFATNFTTLTDGIIVYFIPSHSNTSASTLNVNGLGAVAIVNQNLTALTLNELVAGQVVSVIYKGGSWLLLQGSPTTGVVGFGTDSGSANNYVVTATNPNFSYSPGNVLYFIPANTNTGGSTINVAGLGGQGILSSNNSTLPPLSIMAGVVTEIVYSVLGHFLLVSSPYQVGTFTATLTGMTAATTGTVTYTLDGNVVTLKASSITGTSNSVNMTMTGLPAICQPLTASVSVNCPNMIDNTANIITGEAQVSGGVITFAPFSTTSVATRVVAIGGTFTNSGTKGINNGWTISYPVN